MSNRKWPNIFAIRCARTRAQFEACGRHAFAKLLYYRFFFCFVAVDCRHRSHARMFAYRRATFGLHNLGCVAPKPFYSGKFCVNMRLSSLRLLIKQKNGEVKKCYFFFWFSNCEQRICAAALPKFFRLKLATLNFSIFSLRARAIKCGGRSLERFWRTLSSNC